MAAQALLTPAPPPPRMDDADGAAPPPSAAPVAPPTPTPAPTSEPPPPRRRPPVRVTSEFDSEKRLLSHRFSCRVLDGFAKLRLRVGHGAGGGVALPEVALISRNFSVVVDTASRGAVLRGAANLAGSLRLRALHNTKNSQNEEQSFVHIGCTAHCLSMSCSYEYEKSIVSCIDLDRCFQFKYHSRKKENWSAYNALRQTQKQKETEKKEHGQNKLDEQTLQKEQLGEVAVTANLGDSPCKIELSSLVPPDGLPRASFLFPNGEVSVKEKKFDEGDRILSVSGLAKSHVLNGVCTAVYTDNVMNLKYRYKDDEITFIPSISLPSNSLSFTFKRQLTPRDKLSYWYHFATNYWGAVYKHKADKHIKWKTGYESDTRLGWASLWVGDAKSSTKEVPLKAKVCFTLKVPQDNIQNSVVQFHVKKRWDF